MGIARKFFPQVQSKWGEEGLQEIIQDGSILGVAVVIAGQSQVTSNSSPSVNLYFIHTV